MIGQYWSVGRSTGERKCSSSQNLVSIIIFDVLVVVVNTCVYLCCALDDRLRRTDLATPLEHHWSTTGALFCAKLGQRTFSPTQMMMLMRAQR